MDNIVKDKFKIIGIDDSDSEKIARPRINYWQDAWRRLKRNPVAMTALFMLIAIIIMTIIGPKLRGLDYETIVTGAKNQSPNSEYWFGTDALGRDLFSRVWAGARISIIIALVATLIKVVIGALYGAVMAYTGGVVDEIMMRVVEVLNSIPSFILTMLIIVVLGNGYVPLLIALCITAWTSTARMIRGQIMQLRESEYVLASKALGASNMRVIIKHLLPNTIGLLIL